MELDVKLYCIRTACHGSVTAARIRQPAKERPMADPVVQKPLGREDDNAVDDDCLLLQETLDC